MEYHNSPFQNNKKLHLHNQFCCNWKYVYISACDSSYHCTPVCQGWTPSLLILSSTPPSASFPPSVPTGFLPDLLILFSSHPFPPIPQIQSRCLNEWCKLIQWAPKQSPGCKNNVSISGAQESHIMPRIRGFLAPWLVEKYVILNSIQHVIRSAPPLNLLVCVYIFRIFIKWTVIVDSSQLSVFTADWPRQIDGFMLQLGRPTVTLTALRLNKHRREITVDSILKTRPHTHTRTDMYTYTDRPHTYTYRQRQNTSITHTDVDHTHIHNGLQIQWPLLAHRTIHCQSWELWCCHL